MSQKPLWTPSEARVKGANVSRFMGELERRHGASFASHAELLAFSVSEPEKFWDAVWDFCGLKAAHKGSPVLSRGGHVRDDRFYPAARLNYAENLLRRNDSATALIFWGEERVKFSWSWAELSTAVAQLQRAFARAGVMEGDRICAVVPNHPMAIAGLLAANSIGAIWSSCSPDFGERGILDRFGQIAPKLLLTCDAYDYGGKTHAMTAKIAAVLKELPTVTTAVVFHYTGDAEAMARAIPKGVTHDDFVRGEADGPVTFAQLPFDHPLYILYSSGTTGIPKCIVHRQGGILLKHLAEHVLNTDVKPGDRLFYFTTCGWMMWNWLVSGLAAGATLLLYDGSPFHPSERILFDYADAENMGLFGTSAKYIDALKKTGWKPRDTHRLDALRSMMSTGSPLSDESFDFVYDAIKSDLHLASISGGTDICGCFVGGNPISPVWRGEIQGPMLGMAVDVYDDGGHTVRQEKGELVCTRSFPSMPVMFWNDPDGRKYHAAYFERFANIWCHGDFAEVTAHGGIIIHGRSDATLNPGGVRIGTAEIYAQVERIPEVLEALAIGQDWQGDVRVVLFLRLKEGVALDEALLARIRKEIRDGASPRHVPAKIIKVADIPRTKSGKITELAVRDIVHGRAVKNQEALANPEALKLYENIAALKD